MKINEIIRQQRIAKGMTQEQIASSLGVSTPAVNKWEKAICYPDITLLPSLARLLETDLNTLLSFQEDLSKEEIGSFLDEVYVTSTEKGIDAAFSLVKDKLREYPTCNVLLLNVALVLEDILSLAVHEEKSASSSCRDYVEGLFLRAASGSDPSVANRAKTMLVSAYIEKKEFDKAEALLDELSNDFIVDKKHLQAQLAFAKGDLEQAAEIMERKLISDISSAQAALHYLAEIALKEQRTENAVQLLLTEKQMVSLFDLWDFVSHTVDFQVAIVYKDEEKALESLKKMIPAMRSDWNPSRSDLYPHVVKKSSAQDYGGRLLPKIISELEDPSITEYDFLREDERVQEFLSKIKEDMEAK